MISFSVKLCVLFSAIFLVEGTLTPDGTVSLDCGRQHVFTCNVTGVAALWNISGLDGISTGLAGTSGLSTANNNARITTNDASGGTPSSTITITGFNTADNLGTIQCIDLNDNSVQGMASISVELPSCPTGFSANRDGDFTNATVTYQLATPPPVTSTTVTYCPTSSPNCENSMNCTTSPCTISGLDPCMEYNLSAIPTNNCGSVTGCTGNSMFVAKGIPPCPMMVKIHNSSQSGTEALKCDVTLTHLQPPNSPPVTSTTVTYCPTSSPNCGRSMTCTNPCTISGVDNSTEHQFTVIPNNNCGSATGCTGNMATVQLRSDCTIVGSPTNSTFPPGNSKLLLLLLLIVLLIPLLSYPIGVLIVQLCCYKDNSYCEVFWCCWCCGCCAGGESKRSSSARPIPVDNNADPKAMREKKEKEKLTYAALEFSKQAGSTGEKTIRSKEEPVQYTSVEQA